MSAPTLGIHHITAIASDAQRNFDFYAGLLGLRLVKKTVNFDDPGTYHLYYGDASGSPGTILTFFPWKYARRGSRGAGQVTATALAVPAGSLEWWQERLAAQGVVREEPTRRFGDDTLTLLDPDGLMLELVATAEPADVEPWPDGPIPPEHAIRGLHSATLTLRDATATAALLTGEMGWRQVGGEGSRIRLAAGDHGDPGTLVDLLVAPRAGFGNVAAGGVHHIAWRVPGDREQKAARAGLARRGLQVTEILDRNYFHSVYFREPGGVLFEIATDSPGFATDEPLAKLGQALRLPPWLEANRERIEETLPTLETAVNAAAGGRR